jgi:hypothetical protein
MAPVILEYTSAARPDPDDGAAPNRGIDAGQQPGAQPPVNGKVGLWSKTDSTSYFKDYVVIKK